MDETTLRVVQALEIQPEFRYVLNNAQVDKLRTMGYIVDILETYSFLCLMNTNIKRNDDHGPQS